MFTSFLHPLTTFPTLLSFSLLSPIILRVAVGIYIAYIGKTKISKKYPGVDLFYYIAGAMLIVGLYTQVTAIAGILMLKFYFYFAYWIHRKSSPISIERYFEYVFPAVILLSLIFTGPGLFAFDLPL